MFTDLHPAALRHLSGTEPFHAYCQREGIGVPAQGTKHPVRQWTEALRALPTDQQARIELELSRVAEMGDRDGVQHLLNAGDAHQPPASVPSGPAVALWYFLHDPTLFLEVFLHHEVEEATGWRTARADPRIPLPDLPKRTSALAAALRSFFRLDHGCGRFCAADGRQIGSAYCFSARVADRLRLIDGFSEAGDPAVTRVRPALTVLYAYYPEDGTVLLRSSLRSVDRLNQLVRCFGQTVLRSAVGGLTEAYDLDRLKNPFHPLPDSDDIASVRVKTLHLRYPSSHARRQLHLDTTTADSATAMDEMLDAHARTAPDWHLLRVCYAELLVHLRLADGRRAYPVRLWGDRCSLDYSPLGLRLRRCLRSWSLTHDE